MALYAFVSIPSGVVDGIDFDAIYADLVLPALQPSGFRPIRAETRTENGKFLPNRLQQLLLADLAVFDVSVAGAQVWYDLAVRHALRGNGTVQICSRNRQAPNQQIAGQVLLYHEKDGLPDPLMLQADRVRLRSVVGVAAPAADGEDASPIFQMLPDLRQADMRSLRVAGVSDFWNDHEAWGAVVARALERDRPGDLMLLADEAQTGILRLEACRAAGWALLRRGQYDLAMEQMEAALLIRPGDAESYRGIGTVLSEIGHTEEARVWAQDLLDAHPNDAACWTLLAEVCSHAWSGRVADAAAPGAAAARSVARIEKDLALDAQRCYQSAFRIDPADYHAGVGALSIAAMLADLGITDANQVAPETLGGAVEWASLAARQKNPRCYLAQATLAEVALLCGQPAAAIDLYHRAVTGTGASRFALTKSAERLRMLGRLGLHAEAVASIQSIIEEALSRRPAAVTPRHVLLCSGHMIDHPDRAEPRFPAKAEPIAAAAIAAWLDHLQAGAEDLAISGGACGSDLLFAEACLARGVPLQVHLPFEEPKFLAASVTFAGDGWRDRFLAVTRNSLARVLVISEEVSPPPPDSNPHARNNLWMLHTAIACGPDRLRMVALWNGRAGDGPGGTGDMVERVRKRDGDVRILDTTKLW